MRDLYLRTGVMNGFVLKVCVMTATVLFFVGCETETGPSDTAENGEKAAGIEGAGGPSAQFVGGAACIECHEEQWADWRKSHHDLAMQEATSATVLGDFSERKFQHGGVTTDFFRQGDEFFVRTDGPDGVLADFRIAYTFGVEPLQQYLVTFPDGRLQALPVAWDTRSEAAGGQRWFHLYPGESLDYDDALHWTGPQQNWNYMCAECHSTNLRRGYDRENDRYDTTWTDIDVSCEACHGPGSEHVDWAESGGGSGGSDARLAVDLQRTTDWIFADGIPTARPTSLPAERVEVETCGRCHSRRSLVTGTYRFGDPIADHYRPALLTEGVYHADGQILDEVYVYGSFLQSKMHTAGVRCSDCHDPHSANLKLGNADAVCGQCHRPEVFASKEHHHHEPSSPGAHCVDCHMPSETYMVVDPRRDHSQHG